MADDKPNNENYENMAEEAAHNEDGNESVDNKDMDEEAAHNEDGMNP
jgi:hypothetical protein